MSEFTKGPWKVCDNEIDVYAPETDENITNHNHPCTPTYEENVANAHLIAASPLMYDCCLDMLKYLDTIGCDNEMQSQNKEAMTKIIKSAIPEFDA